MASSAGIVMIASSALFLAGASIAVPRVFTEPDREEKLRLLEDGLLRWRLGQPLYAVGAIGSAVAVGLLAADADSASSLWLAVSACLLFAGAVAWSWSVYLRAVRHREFALGRLPGWPFATYVWLTSAGLLVLGVGLVLGDWSDRLGWLTVGAAAVFLGAYLRYRDIPPFVFYLLLAVVGVVVL